MVKIVVRAKGKVFTVEEKTVQEQKDELWNQRYKQFLDFVKKYGHQKVPTDDKSPNYTPDNVVLGRWVQYQRQQLKAGKLSDWQYSLLIKAQFIFDPYETYWETKYNELIEFKKKFGHCVISCYDKNHLELAEWLKKQKYRKHKLTPERLNKLNDIGVDWGIKRNPWDEMYKWLYNYYIEHGEAYVMQDKNVKYSDNELNRLNRWCRKQMEHHIHGRLSLDKIQLLENIQFIFDRKNSIADNLWENFYERLLQFKNKFGHCAVPSQYIEDIRLAVWVAKQRKNKTKLKPEQIERLDILGFKW